MTTLTLTKPYADYPVSQFGDSVGNIFVKTVVVDAPSYQNGTGFASGDVLEAITVPAGTLVIGAHWKVQVAEGSSLTCDIGDGGSATKYASNVNLNSTSTEGYILNVTADSSFYATADTIDIHMDGAATHFRLQVDVIMVPFNPRTFNIPAFSSRV